MRILPHMAFVGALVLAGCSDEPDAPEFNNSAEITNNAAAPPAPPPASNVVEREAPPLEFDDEAQMRDDADATGLTARLPREGDGATTPANAAAPR